MEITILCKVVDNFGDIGVVFRMANHLLSDYPETQVNLIVDDLLSFNKICSDVNPQMDFQIINGLNVYNWNNFSFCYDTFKKNDGEKLSIILECFQCGRPDWMEKILFEDKLNRTVQIIMIDYLTAEDYAESFHCLQSLTRSAKVQKVNFMPGFTDKTGGLVIDEAWKNLPKRNPCGNILIFTYERDWTGLAKALNRILCEASLDEPSDSFCGKNEKKVCVAQGRGKDSFVKAWADVSGKMEMLEELPFLNQSDWDALMQKSSVLVIRGEESMSRACLSGIPFIWHAYPQSDEYQLVKVNALLSKLRPYFPEEYFRIIEEAWIGINQTEMEEDALKLEEHIYKFFEKANNLELGFVQFAMDLRKNGDLVHKLMTFIDKNIII
ncbi:MAG: elongation factor P maturation arginine rhamnosyltransferase EarP [Treponema sp.]|nr:elongation factor P maturation arginine rhamnosyltransferase EarP [Treponema sp.]